VLHSLKPLRISDIIVADGAPTGGTIDVMGETARELPFELAMSGGVLRLSVPNFALMCRLLPVRRTTR
jgi:hypothetical protein